MTQPTTSTQILTQEAELMALSSTHSVSSRASSFVKDPSPPPPLPPEIPNLIASSMVQKWRIMELRKLHSLNNNISSSECGNDGEAEEEMECRKWRGYCSGQGGEMGVYSPRVRGRGALLELLERMARERKVELEGVEQRQCVGRFPHRVRIQSVIRLRLCNGIHGSPLHVSDYSPPLPEQSAVSTLRQRFHSGEVSRSSATVYGSNEKEDVEENSSRRTDDDTNNKEDPGTSGEENETEEEYDDDDDDDETVQEEQKEEDKQIPVETANCDWVSHISRPQRDWEECRRARYEEMMLQDNEICHLLDRRSVSSFLVSDYKDRMDRLMMTIAQSKISRINPIYLEQDQTSMFHNPQTHEEEKEEEMEEEYVEGIEEDYRFGGENSSDILSPSPPHPSRSHSSNDCIQTHHLSKDIEELRQEIQELKKLIKSSHPKAKRRGKNKGGCSVCHEMEVDSLLYRCGHVCTCIGCARELQGGGRLCPVCQAPIDDVVQIILPLT